MRAWREWWRLGPAESEDDKLPPGEKLVHTARRIWSIIKGETSLILLASLFMVRFRLLALQALAPSACAPCLHAVSLSRCLLGRWRRLALQRAHPSALACTACVK